VIARPRGRDLERPELEDLVARLAGRTDLWEHLVRHDPVERVYEELVRDNHLAVWLICWMDDHDTGFHDHDRSAGAVAVTRGAVIEDRLLLGGGTTSRRSPPAARSRSPPRTSTASDTAARGPR